ncbi:MAG: MBL fold metallo-hydrolase [Candidatus Thorarchaeota archaeon]|jgi:ribonuclease BN (tRNA processing enzyme)
MGPLPEWLEMATSIILLGTGTPNIDPARSGPSIAIIIDDSSYIIDFGPGVVRRAVEAGLKSSQLTRAFLTHLHSDHTGGYPDLILTPAVDGRSTPLEVYGPVGLQSMTNHILAAYEEDIQERVNGLEPANPECYVVECHEIDKDALGVIYQDDRVSVEAFPVVHGSWPAYGYKFTSSDRTIVISGDTAPTPVLVEKARDCDVLVHEVYSAVALKNREPEWIRYHTSMHTSSHELAEIASEVQPKLLVLYHQLFWSKSDAELLEEVKSRYDGQVVSGNDLDVF